MAPTASEIQNELADRVAIITGAGNGIGRGIALELAARGANVVLADISVEAASAVAREVESLGRRPLVTETDVTDPTSTDAMVAAALEEFGSVDIMVNNAGVYGAQGWWDRPEAGMQDWDATFEVNVFGIVHGCQSVSPHFMERRSGKIINIASVAGRQGRDLSNAHYGASKAAAINVSQAWAHKLAPYSVNVNTLCPGLLYTPLWERIAGRRIKADPTQASASQRDVFEQAVKQSVPLGREQVPEDVGKAAAFLVSDRARNITGQALNVDGGLRKN